MCLCMLNLSCHVHVCACLHSTEPLNHVWVCAKSFIHVCAHIHRFVHMHAHVLVGGMGGNINKKYPLDTAFAFLW